MAKSLVVVESPTKVKTINKILGASYKVVSSMGHLVDLPKSQFGVDVDNNFKPRLIVVRKKQKVVTALKKEAAKKKNIYIATDPDREGEAIGWNISNLIEGDKNFYRVVFHEITREAVLKAFEHPRKFDRKKIDAQIGRRILDRIVGYQLSPLLWKKVGSRLSAGRVQSVALRLVVEREREIESFVPREYWQITIDVQKAGSDDILSAALEKIGGEKAEIATEAQAQELVAQIRPETFTVSNISQRQVKRNPSPPFITSTMQQEAFNKLNFSADKTMLVAQQLYEGIELGDGETVGLITYMRTDSVNIAKEAVSRVRRYIKDEYGSKYLPDTPNTFKSKKSAQEAHEAIRPSDVDRHPKAIQHYLSPEQYKLYALIWKRFLACQMTPALYQNRRIEITAGRFQFGASGSTLLFDGYLAAGGETRESDDSADLSHYAVGDMISLTDVRPSQHFTKPPPRYSDGTLVKALEEAGIGRPSTYAPIIKTLVYRSYVHRQQGYFHASDLGMQICALLVEYFPKIMDIGFTATMEEHLDLIEEGKLKYTELLREFYQPFKEELDYAMQNIEKTVTYVDKTCPQCGRPMSVKWGRNGRFLSCSGFPECKFSHPFLTGVRCPQEGCGGELVERRSYRGGMFFGCSNYPNCRFVSKKLPDAAH